MLGETYIAEKVMDRRVADSHAAIEARHLARRIRPSQRSWFSKQARGLVCEVGFLMVRFGAWLETQSLTAASSIQGDTQ
jgi:hypothetical protein